MDIEENVIFGAPVNWMTEYDYVSASEYITALYWSVMTLTTIGYGDVAPVTLGEQCLCIFAMLLGGSIYAYVIGAVCGIVSSMDEATTAYHKTMDELNIFMVENKLPKELRVRLREYFQHCRQLQRAQHYQDLLVHMSPMLRGEVAVFCNREWVLKVPFFNGAPEEETNNFITSIALALVLEAYAPHETIIKKGEPTEKMYIVQRGVVSRLGHVYSSGACVGEDMILKGAKRTSDVRALTYVDVSGLHRVRTRVGGLLESMHGACVSNIRCVSVAAGRTAGHCQPWPLPGDFEDHPQRRHPHGPAPGVHPLREVHRRHPCAEAVAPQPGPGGRRRRQAAGRWPPVAAGTHAAGTADRVPASPGGRAKPQPALDRARRVHAQQPAAPATDACPIPGTAGRVQRRRRYSQRRARGNRRRPAPWRR